MANSDYDDPEIYLRDDEVCDTRLWWLRGDNGAWEGPSREFAPLCEEMLKWARGRDTIVQAGGCLGMYPRLWSPHFRRVVTAEPCPVSFSVLERNCVGDQYTRINAALGDTTEPVVLYRGELNNVGTHSITRPNSSGITVSSVRVDDLELDSLDVMQLDVEGYEIRVLLGADSMIRKFHPVISVETLTGDVRNLLDSHGYKLRAHRAADTIFSVD